MRIASDVVFIRRGSRALAPVVWTAFLGLCVFFQQFTQAGQSMIPGAILFISLGVVSLFDLGYLIIPDGPLILLCLIAPFSWPVHDLQETSLRICAAAAGYSGLRLAACAFEVARGHAGLGAGDARLYAIAGLWLGFTGLPGCFIYATISALVWAIIALRLGELGNMREPMPFGPHLSLGIWLTYVIGPVEFG